MNIPDNFYCLLIRGKNICHEEKNRIKEIYLSYGRERLYDIAKAKKILPFAANSFVYCDIDTSFWSGILNEYRERNEKILVCLDNAYTALKAHGVKKMFVSENFGALLSANEDIALFASGDIDNYADFEERDNIYSAFESLGWTRKERFTERNQIAAEFFPPVTEGLPEKFYISVDFNPLARLKLPCFIEADRFVDWERLSVYGDTEITLPPVNALMYICMLHISLHSFSRAPDIRLYIDLLNMSRTSVDYEKIAEWCRRDGTCTRAAVSSTLSNYLMNTDIPECITEISKRKNKIVELVYLPEKNDLIYEPHGLKVLRIEVLCNDKSSIRGVYEILSPNKCWMDKTYGSHGVVAHMKHIIKVL